MKAEWMRFENDSYFRDGVKLYGVVDHWSTDGLTAYYVCLYEDAMVELTEKFIRWDFDRNRNSWGEFMFGSWEMAQLCVEQFAQGLPVFKWVSKGSYIELHMGELRRKYERGWPFASDIKQPKKLGHISLAHNYDPVCYGPATNGKPKPLGRAGYGDSRLIKQRALVERAAIQWWQQSVALDTSLLLT